MPRRLWRHAPDEAALAALSEHERYRGETNVRQVVKRVAGSWAYHGWKGGYFDSEQDALAFFDDVRWLLWHRKISPSLAQWRHAGLYWAYGLRPANDGSFITDYRSGAVRRAEEQDLAPRGAFINGVGESLSGDGGAWDLWRREASILQRGGNCGANVSDMASPSSCDTGTGLAALLAVGDAAARATCGATSESLLPRRITVDAAHPESRAVVQRAAEAMNRRAEQASGQRLARRHIDAIIDACRRSRMRKSTDPRTNPALRLAIQSARQAMLPGALIERTLDLISQGEPPAPTRTHADAGPHSDSGAVTVIRADDATLRRTTGPIDDAAMSAWTTGRAGLQFDTTVQAGNSCPESGPIRSASGDGSFLFLDDTACDYAVLNAAAYLLDDGSFDIDGFRHAAQLLTVMLDISLMTAAQPTPRLARRVWDFRPVGLSIAGVGACLVARGIAYDSDEGRATCGALCALMTGTAYLTAARLAAEMGSFPAWPDNAEAMQRVIRKHADSAMAMLGAAHPDLVAAVRAVWEEALDTGACSGYRNAQVSHLVDAEAEASLLDCGSRGLEPLPSLIRFERLAAGGWQKTAEPAVAHGLHALGYTDDEIDAILRHLLGHGTLAHAPGVNHETLRRRGFTDNALLAVEAALPVAPDIGLVFNRWTLGETWCRRMLGFTAGELADEGFDMLAALGFSDAGVEAANIYCCGAGTLEGAPYLDPDHLAVFDCARPQGERGRRHVSTDGVIRMMAAAQPMISGAIGHTLAMPHSATVADCRAAFMLGWRLGLKSMTMRRDGADRVAAATHDTWLTPTRGTAAALSVVKADPLQPAGLPEFGRREISAGGMSQVLALAHTARAVAAVKRPDHGPTSNNRTDVAEDGEDATRDAETSRRAASHAARSTASVPSSADVVVEQRQV